MYVCRAIVVSRQVNKPDTFKMSKFQIPKEMHVKKSDAFRKELEYLVTFGTGMTWQDDETINFACSGAHEMMDTESLELPNDPSHEYRQEKAEKLREASIKSEEERVRLYGTDDSVMEKRRNCG